MTLVFGGMVGYAATAGLCGVYEGITSSRGKKPFVHTRCYFLLIGTVMVVHVTFMVFYKKIAAYLERRPAQPLMHRLASITDARRKALVL